MSNITENSNLESLNQIANEIKGLSNMIKQILETSNSLVSKTKSAKVEYDSQSTSFPGIYRWHKEDEV